MVPDKIEREIFIDAPVDVVWEVLTTPDEITQWFSDAAKIDLQPGGDGILTWHEQGIEKAGNEGAVVQLRVERVERPHFFAFRWDHPAGAEPREDNSLLVEFSLAAEGEGTRLHLVESGLRGLNRSDEERDAYRETHSQGWDIHLGKLREYVSGQRKESAGR
jgi:uncharacterized protein YndB with AHSA1/START domain